MRVLSPFGPRPRGLRIRCAALAALAGCGGGGDPTGGGAAPDDPCAGGGTPEVLAGDGGAAGFTPWSDGDVVPITQQGEYGFALELQVRGLDLGSALTTFVRYSLGADPATEDVGATVTFVCDEADGSGWAGVFVPLDDALQDAGAVAGLDGEDMHLTVLASDAAGATDDEDVALVLSAP